MPLKIKIILENTSKENITWNLGSVFQGVIMEHIGFEYGEKLHVSELKPYSQYILNKNGEIQWVINILNNEAEKNIADVITSTDFSTIHLEKKNIDLKIKEKTISKVTYEEIIEKYFFGCQNRIIQFNFITPTSFKSNGEYVFYPTVRHMFQSLINKFDAFCPEAGVKTETLLDDIETNTKVIGYNLRSVKFSVEGVKIPSFVGQLQVKITGPQQLVNLLNLIAFFGSFSGVGIKCAMGMGALEVGRERE